MAAHLDGMAFPCPATASVAVKYLFTIRFQTRPPIHFGSGPNGRKTVGYIEGGEFSGPLLSGQVVPGGGDWVHTGPDGGLSLDVRTTLRTDRGSFVHMSYLGRWIAAEHAHAEVFGRTDKAARIPPEDYYLRITPLFESGARECQWLNDVVAIGYGRTTGSGIVYEIFALA